ncbi:sensor histidine kinase [Lutispora thermophila]|uniref:histidine kinase n=1 Tax=Lutispora thermophila DSM 19022 TaxID=1122184 RepID=A0A1M6E6H5_9FIRM|nr:sensor histidine kinase [Lutispora thermophila]SHI81025.1 Signal transduction histidine kinase [Lutispora thermophila DSM 19022]
MDINLKDDINNRESMRDDNDIADIKDNQSYEENISDNKHLKDKDAKKSSLAASTWGTMLMMLILSAVSVGSYAPLKNYIFESFAGFPYYWYLDRYIILVLSIGVISLLLLIITAFAIPYSHQQEASIVKIFNRIFIEFKAIIWFIFLALIYIIAETSLYSDYESQFNIATMLYNANLGFYLIGIPVTFILYNLIYLSITYIKHIYHTGFVSGFIKNSIFGKLLFYVANLVKEIANGLMEINTNDDSHRNLLKLLGIHLIVLGFISLAYPLGPFLAIVYTGFLFSYLTKVIDKAKTLTEASSKLAEGNFDIVVPEDMGILTPYARNLNNIKEGFRLAVEKELKSQNMKTELISNVSHDLKTPLTSIITYVDLLKKDDIDDETRKEYIDILDKKSKRLKILIEDLFEASKASSGNIELHMEKLDVVALLRQTLGELEEKINNSSLHMKINLPDKKVTCQLDGRKTYRIFDNIIGNILKYAMPNSRVYIDAEENDKEISFIFKNISAYEMNFDPSEIMERFTRGDKSRNTEGSGLGLAIAKSLVELQRGKININIDGDLFKLTVTFPKIDE